MAALRETKAAPAAIREAAVQLQAAFGTA